MSEMKMTEAQKIEVRNTMEVLQSKLSNTIDSLAFRWKNESKYEDIAEYQKVVAKQTPKSIKVIGMSKRPLGAIFETNGLKYLLFVKGRLIRIRCARDERSLFSGI